LDASGHLSPIAAPVVKMGWPDGYIAFDVDGEEVSIIGIFYGGQDHESLLRGDEPNG
jgi:hypothetical protein